MSVSLVTGGRRGGARRRRHARGPYRHRDARNATRPLPPTAELLWLVRREAPDWEPVHRALRGTTPAWCTRCDQPCRLPFGPGEGLCQPCRNGERHDREQAPW